MRAFNTETRTLESDWPKSVDAIQSIINNSPSRRLNGRAPITVHTGMEPGNPLNLALSTSGSKNVKSIDEVQLKQKLNIESILNALDVMHREVKATLTKTRK